MSATHGACNSAVNKTGDEKLYQSEQQRKAPDLTNSNINPSSSSNPNLKQSTLSPSSEGKQAFPAPLSKLRKSAEKKVVGLKNYAISPSLKNIRKHVWITTSPPLSRADLAAHHDIKPSAEAVVSTPEQAQIKDENTCRKAPDRPIASEHKSIEDLESVVRKEALLNPFRLLLLGIIGSLKVMGLYLVTIETFLTCGLTIGLTMYWYDHHTENSEWSGGGLDFVLLAFAVTTPISAAIGMAFTRRERALVAIANFRSFSYHLFCAHCMWDWSTSDSNQTGREQASSLQQVDWLEHCDAVLAQLIGIGDEFSRFLTLPTCSRSRHRMTRQGRREAALTMQVSYYLLESATTQRMTRLIMYGERLKRIGLPSGEVSRIKQYERFISDVLEQLRIIKLYRTPQALRAFARIFTILLPPFYAPTYAQVAKELESLPMGILFGVITALCLTALFESLEVLEDPFTAFLALDGIDAREEFEVLHYSQLTQTRKLVFPDAPDYPAGRRAALTKWNRHGSNKHSSHIGTPPTQAFHTGATVAPNTAPSINSVLTFEETDQVTAMTGGDATPKIPKAVIFDSSRAEAELGAVLPPDDNMAYRRYSSFEEDKKEGVKRNTVNCHIRNDSLLSQGTIVVEREPGSGRTIKSTKHRVISKPEPSNESPFPTFHGDASAANRSSNPRPRPYHNRTHTNLSAAEILRHLDG
mmetsp:Transcript_7843/g.11370  ORF Transcript_7843/g.11370 Transcript_7843/m.11370 type:complete len:697 (+) Transcript_7843:154-2244(+)